ncbi:DUF4834 family protein [Dysgonomonas sp. ZJ709]|uniref:DUF4834 family protein n=1 Tax=Dysgonomonas sp. ZJ709 TaxID=2709797 RepID=UPI0013EB58B4|nr:DUF4834 family protein [Dysgonomonas sp. ZJ709]
MKILLFLVITSLMLGIMLILSVFRKIASMSGKHSSYSKYNANNRNANSPVQDDVPKKIFSENEGEYIKYEELKD